MKLGLTMGKYWQQKKTMFDVGGHTIKAIKAIKNVI